MLEDIQSTNEALMLRHTVCEKMIKVWEKKHLNKAYEFPFTRAREMLAKLLDCYDPDFHFYKSIKPDNKKFGVEPHVLEGLRQFAGPYGRVIYKAMKIKKQIDWTYD